MYDEQAGEGDTGLGKGDFGWGSANFHKMGRQKVGGWGGCCGWLGCGCLPPVMAGQARHTAPRKLHACPSEILSEILDQLHTCGAILPPSARQVDLARTFTGYGLDLCLCDVDTVWINGAPRPARQPWIPDSLPASPASQASRLAHAASCSAARQTTNSNTCACLRVRFFPMADFLIALLLVSNRLLLVSHHLPADPTEYFERYPGPHGTHAC